MSSLTTAIGFVLGEEGGFQKRADDPGNWVDGKLVGTKYGIAAKYHPHEDIPGLTRQRAISIYEHDYWAPARCDGLPAGLALMHMDAAVNIGVGGAAHLLQRALGVTDDGVIGPQTLGAAATCDEAAAIRDYAVERLIYYARLVTDHNRQRDAKGWALRTRRARDAALELTNGPPMRAA